MKVYYSGVLVTISIILLAGMAIPSAYAAVITINPDCDTPDECFWNQGTTWIGGVVPNIVNGDTAIISADKSVSVPQGGVMAEVVQVEDDGTIRIAQSFQQGTVTIGSTLDNNGLVILAPGNDIGLQFTGANPVIEGTGQISIFDGNVISGVASIFVNDPSKTLTHQADHTIVITKKQTSVNIPNQVGSFVNHGTINLREGVLNMNPSSPVDNFGTLQVRGDLEVPGEVRFSGSLGQDVDDVFNNFGTVKLDPLPNVPLGIFKTERLFVNHCGGEVTPSINNIQTIPPFTGEIRNIECSSIHGEKWIDLTGNGVRDGSEPGLGNVRIYLDLNNNDVLDGNEPFTTTMQDDPNTAFDETGMYWLEDLNPGDYTVREVMPNGFVQTFPSGGEHIVIVNPGDIIDGINFGNQQSRTIPVGGNFMSVDTISILIAGVHTISWAIPLAIVSISIGLVFYRKIN